MSTRIVLGEASPVVREGLRSILRNCGDVEVVTETSSGEDTIRAALDSRADVIILDLNLPGLEAIETIRQIRGQQPTARFIVFSRDALMGPLEEALRAGASGCITLDSSPAHLVEAVEAVRSGRFFVPPSIATDLTGSMVRRSNHLSPRERDVLRLIAGGLSNRDAGKRLGVSERTIESHRRNLMKKLEVHRVVDLVRYAIRESMISA